MSKSTQIAVSGGAGVKSRFSSSGATPWCSAACWAAFLTLSGRTSFTHREPHQRDHDHRQRPVERQPVRVVSGVGSGLERAVEAQQRCRDGHQHDQVLPPRAAELPQQNQPADGEQQVHDLDRERAGGGRHDERRELLRAEDRHELVHRAAGGHDQRGTRSRPGSPGSRPTECCAERSWRTPWAAGRHARGRSIRGPAPRRSPAPARSHPESRPDRSACPATSPRTPWPSHPARSGRRPPSRPWRRRPCRSRWSWRRP